MPTPMTNAQNVANWREANAEIVQFDSRLRDLTNGIINCQRRIIYASKNADTVKQPGLQRKYRASVSLWIERRARYKADLLALLEDHP